MYTANDIAKVFEYNKTHSIFNVTATKRVMWSVRNLDKQRLQEMLSQRFEYAEDFAQLKKQVKAELASKGLLA